MWSQEEKLQIVLLHLEQGIPKKVLSKQFGVNVSLLYVWCKQYCDHCADQLLSQNDTLRLQPTVDERRSINMNAKKAFDRRNAVIGELIREKREAKNWSQSTLAEAVGLSQQHISPVERGVRSISVERLLDICDQLSFSLCDIQERLDAPPYTITLASNRDIPDIQKLIGSRIPENTLFSYVSEGRIYVLRGTETIVGVCCYSLLRQAIPCLDFLYIDEKSRRSGYGIALIQHWESAMKDWGHEYVMAVFPEIDNTKAFLKEAGYCSICSVLPPAQASTEVFYSKPLV